MTNQERIAFATAVIAAVTVLVTILNSRRTRQQPGREETTKALRSLLQKLEETHFFGIDPEQEIWKFGFDKMKEISSLSAAAVAANRKFVPENVRASVLQFHEQVKGIRAFQDSWLLFSEGKNGDWREIQKSWPDRERANTALQVAKPVAAQCKRELSSFLNKV